jgi:hypothetical protein
MQSLRFDHRGLFIFPDVLKRPVSFMFIHQVVTGGICHPGLFVLYGWGLRVMKSICRVHACEKHGYGAIWDFFPEVLKRVHSCLIIHQILTGP